MGHTHKAPRAARVLMGIMLAVLAFSAAGQKIYRSVGPDGKAVFSDRPPADRDAVVLPPGRASAPASAPAPSAAASSPNAAAIAVANPPSPGEPSVMKAKRTR